MKNTLTALLLGVACMLTAQTTRVLSVQDLGEGYYPQINAEGTEIIYLDNEAASYTERQASGLYVTNEDLNLVLYRDSKRTVLNPRGNDVHYVWSSVSPDGKRIIFHTKYGTEICDLNGRIIANLGMLIDPHWYGNDYVVGSTETSDGHQYLSSCIAIIRADGTGYQALTNPAEMGMHPTVSPKSGRVAYGTLDGKMRMLQLSLADEPIRQVMPAVTAAPQAMRAPARVKRASYKQPSEVKIYINPGHGGWDSDDRNMVIYPYKLGDHNGFWESQSNLDKGLRLRDLLNELGVQNTMSRTTNTTADDLPLSTIVAEANAYKPDFFLSIHSNAGNPSNYVLQLYAGKDAGDTHSYPSATPCSDEGRAITTVLGNILYENQVADWTNQPQIRGDKTFARQIFGWSNGYGVLRGLKVPGTISEGSMHDYIPETYRLMNMQYKWKEAFYFARLFMEYFCNYTIPVGGIGGQVRDIYLPMEFPKIGYHKGTPDGQKPICGALVTLSQGGTVLQTYTTDELYNGLYFFFDLQPGEYKVSVKAEGYYEYSYTETVTAAHISYHNVFMNMERSTPLEVVSYSPAPESITDSVEVSSNVLLNFNWDCRTDSVAAAFSVTPAVEGTITFENDNHTLRFAPEGRFEPGVEYTVHLSTKACHADETFDNHLKQPFEFSFRTKVRGNIRYLGSYPANGDIDVPLKPSFVALFDQELVSSTPRTTYALTDLQGNEVKINSRSITYNQAPKPYGYVSFEITSELQPATEYVLTIKGSLQDNIGVYLVDDKLIHFTTETPAAPPIPRSDMMDTLLFVPDYEASINAKSVSTLRNTSTKYNSSYKASNELSYEFAEEGDAEAYFMLIDPSYISTLGAEDRLGMYVFSDFSGNTVYLRCEVAGDIQYVKLCDLDYGGWKWQEADLTTLPKGIEYQLMAIRVVRGESLLSSKGSIYLNDLSYEYNPQTGVENTSSDKTVAAPQKLLLDGHLYIQRDGKMYDAEGMEIK